MQQTIAKNTKTAPPMRRISVKTNTMGEGLKTDVEISRKEALNQQVQENLESLAASFSSAGQGFTVANEKLTGDTATKKMEVFVKTPRIDLPEEKPIETEETVNTYSQERSTRQSYGTKENLGPHAERQDLPSNGVFYEFTDLMIRPFEVPEFVKLEKANRTKNDSLIIDVMDSTLSVDARDLTQKDFRYLMYHQRITSYVRNPYKLNWVSFYGNNNIIELRKTNLNKKDLQATQEEYKSWQARGFHMPTVRNLEEYDSIKEKLSEEDKFIWTRAKYFSGDTVQQKLEHAQSVDPDTFFVDTKEFVLRFEDYGVVETADVVDKFFDAKLALERLQSYVDRVELLLSSSANNVDVVDSLLERSLQYREEIKRINDEISNKGEAAPKRETIEFSINITDFFPVL